MEGSGEEEALWGGRGDGERRQAARGGYTIEAVRNRIQEDLGAHIAQRMVAAHKKDHQIAVEQQKQAVRDRKARCRLQAKAKVRNEGGRAG